jgi:hypothetical protein
MRATVSTKPPGGYWQIKRMGPLLGQAEDWAWIHGAANVAAPAANKSRRFMGIP